MERVGQVEERDLTFDAAGRELLASGVSAFRCFDVSIFRRFDVSLWYTITTFAGRA
jgi:hypothetical protein